jgi:hypothetical protein
LLGPGVCAEPETEPISAAQHSTVGKDTDCIMRASSIAITICPSCKGSLGDTGFARD